MAASNHPLCLRCGLCCDGTLFRAVELRRGDSAATLRGQGLSLQRRASGCQLPQPCAALEGCLCRIYAQRPSHCRTFDCRVLRRVGEGELTRLQGVRRVLRARRLATEARRLLVLLGELDSDAPIRLRFQRVMRAWESGEGGHGDPRHLAGLSQTMHELGLLLASEFYV